MKQRDLAEAIGVSINQASERLSGTVAFRLDELEPVAALVGVSVAYLVGAETQVGAA